MLRIVYPICCGLDVHKDFVYACIATTENGVTTYKSHRFSTFTKGLRELLSWLLQKQLQGCLYGIYGEILDSHLQYP